MGTLVDRPRNREFGENIMTTTDQDRASELIAKMARNESVISLPEIDLTKVNETTLPLLHSALAEGFVTLIKSQANVVEEMLRRRNLVTDLFETM